MRKCSKSHGHYNGVMLQFLGSSSIMYWGSNRKSGSLSQKLGSPPYLNFGLATSAPWTPVFAVFWPVNKRLEMLFIRKSGVSVVKSKSVAKTRTGSSSSPHFGLRSKVAQKCSWLVLTGHKRWCWSNVMVGILFLVLTVVVVVVVVDCRTGSRIGKLEVLAKVPRKVRNVVKSLYWENCVRKVVIVKPEVDLHNQK